MACRLFFLPVSLLVCAFGLKMALGEVTTARLKKFDCEFAPGLTVGNRSHELECCEEIYSDFYSNWAYGRQYITTLFETLRGWNCSQFQQECSARTFDYNDFTKLTYDKFCNHSQLEAKCSEQIKSLIDSQHPSASLSWTEAVSRLDIASMKIDELLKPCVQIATYERDSGGHGNYHEIIQPLLPFCSFVWCGFDARVVADRGVSAWTCMPRSCKSSIIAVMVVCGILALAVFICNATVLLVLLRSRNFHHGQSVYRLSLAFADILVGIFVFPTFISTLVKYVLVEHEVGELKNVTGYVVGNDTERYSGSDVSFLEFHGPGGLFSTRFPRSYLNMVGFFTVLSLVVSIYTLVAAAFDRFVAVYRPLRYKQKSAVTTATRVACGLWLVALIFATMPYYVRTLRYGVVASILVSSGGDEVVVLYTIAFILPLLVMWVITVATLCISRKITHEWSGTSEDDVGKKQRSLEMRLVRTLGIMVGVFTLSLLPSCVALLVPFTSSDIYYNDPMKLNQQSAVNYTSSEVVVIMLLMTNSLWNCFIYSARDRDFRDTAKHMYVQAGRALKLNLICNCVKTRLGLSSQRHRVSSDCDNLSRTEESRVAQCDGNETYNATTEL